MRVVRDQIFAKGYGHAKQRIQNLRLEGCTFDGNVGLFPQGKKGADPARRPIIRNVELKDTKVLNGLLSGAILEDVTVDTTKGRVDGTIFLRGNAYKHVSLVGRITSVEIRGKISTPYEWHEDDSDGDEKRLQEEAVWDAANADFYTDVDWAIDIRQASFASLTIEGVPAKLIRRDRKTTAIVTRKRALALKDEWKELPYGLFHVVIDQMLDDGYEDTVLIACPRSKNFEEQMSDLAAMLKVGVAK